MLKHSISYSDLSVKSVKCKREKQLKRPIRSRQIFKAYEDKSSQKLCIALILEIMGL